MSNADDAYQAGYIVGYHDQPSQCPYSDDTCAQEWVAGRAAGKETRIAQRRMLSSPNRGIIIVVVAIAAVIALRSCGIL